MRGVGPGLLDGDPTLAGRELADPQLKLFEMQSGAFALLTSNDNWGGASTLSQKFAELGQGARRPHPAANHLEDLLGVKPADVGQGERVDHAHHA